MKIRMTLTLDVDTQAWATEYGIAASPANVRADVKSSTANDLHEMYVNGPLAHLYLSAEVS